MSRINRCACLFLSSSVCMCAPTAVFLLFVYRLNMCPVSLISVPLDVFFQGATSPHLTCKSAMDMRCKSTFLSQPTVFQSASSVCASVCVCMRVQRRCQQQQFVLTLSWKDQITLCRLNEWMILVTVLCCTPRRRPLSSVCVCVCMQVCLRVCMCVCVWDGGVSPHMD